MNAERVQFVGDENGWELHVTTEGGETLRFNVHALAWGLVDHMNDTIGDWRQEGLAAAGLASPGTPPTGVAPPSERITVDEVARQMLGDVPPSAGSDLTAEDLEAYPPGSPKWYALQEALEFGRYEVLGICPHGVDLDRAFCKAGCRV